MTAAASINTVRSWLEQPNVHVIGPGAQHIELLDSVLASGKATGSLVSDGVLAAIALENGAAIASTDRDFTRFPGLKWLNPLDP